MGQLSHFFPLLRTAGLWHLIEPLLNIFDDAPEIIFHILGHAETTQAELFATTLWSIWKRRNLTLWQQVTESNRNVVERAKHLLEEWRHANLKQLPNNSCTRGSCCHETAW